MVDISTTDIQTFEILGINLGGDDVVLVLTNETLSCSNPADRLTSLPVASARSITGNLQVQIPAGNPVDADNLVCLQVRGEGDFVSVGILNGGLCLPVCAFCSLQSI